MENSVRITNICYPRGSVVYCIFDKNSEYYFLNMRPLIVVSNQTQMFDSLSCIACGSRDRPGIEISLMNHMYGRWIGGHQFSVAQPYALYTVLVSQIAEFHGVIDPYTMKAIDKAMEIIVERIEEQHLADNNVIVVEVEKDDSIPLTITGLLAQKVLSIYGKPCLIGRTGTDGFLRGSMRSSGNFVSLPNFKEFLEESEIFDYVAG